MTWTTKLKDLSTTATVGYTNTDPHVVGRTPTVSTISFSPLELFGAAARCSHLHTIDPTIATPESDMIAKLVGTHVDNVSDDFAVLASADTFKDYVKGYFTGTVGAGLGYLSMINEGYVWADHFENAGGGNPAHKRRPDFVFGSDGLGIALMEAKGSRSGSLSGFDATLGEGYTEQVEPHLGHVVGGGMATHGYCVGSWLKSTTQAELRIHHTRTTRAQSGAGGAAEASLETIQRHNFATAFTLAHSPQLGGDLRRGLTDSPEIMFLRTKWLGRRWLTGFELSSPFWPGPVEWPLEAQLTLRRFRWGWPFWRPPLLIFALEERIAKAALARFLGRGDEGSAEAPDLRAIDEDTLSAARAHRADGGAGAVFLDGLAILDWRRLQLDFELVVWDPVHASFRDV